MIIKSISIRKNSYYSYTTRPKADDPFLAHIEVESPFGEVKLNIDADRTKQIVALIADLVAEAGRQTAEAMTAEVINANAFLPAE